jgi:dihydrofolate reductase
MTMSPRKLVVSEFITLDGVMEDPGGGEGTKIGGWAFQFERGPEGDRFKLEELLASDALLLGRRTYQAFAAAWPGQTGSFADKLNAIPKYVVSNSLEHPSWNNTNLIRGDVRAGVARLKELPGGDILIAGSGQLVQLLFDEGLVDELRLMIYPIVLGEGRRLFQATGKRQALKLVDAQRTGAGILALVYTMDRGA